MIGRPFPDPHLDAGEKVTYRALMGKERRETGGLTVQITATPESYSVAAEFTAHNADAGGSWDVLLRREDGAIRAESAVVETTHGGQLVSRDESRFLGVSTLQFGAELKPFPVDVMPMLGLPVALRTTLRHNARRSFPMAFATAAF